MKYEKVLITGASSGIGRGMALWWAKRGATVWATARRTKNLDELAAQGEGRIRPVAMDVSREAETVAAIQQIDLECGGLDLVVANAGVGGPTPAHLSDWARVETVLRTNVMGAAATLTAVLPRMLERGHGHVAGVSSVAGYTGLGAYSSYNGSKAFLSIFLQSLSIDVYGTGVKVTCIEPGFVKSEMTDRIEGRAPMPFRASTEVAVEKYCRAILKGARRISWPTVHAVSSAALRWVPAPVMEPIAQKISKPQVALVEEELKLLKASP
ncbi:MAG: SDR family NAD(P)-dependent oxidoreductase [Archangiaceae bacterium]|nr:SDR family NAD(P)-dependent oxidoreductase [Archangiaceae bacterium]